MHIFHRPQNPIRSENNRNPNPYHPSRLQFNKQILVLDSSSKTHRYGEISVDEDLYTDRDIRYTDANVQYTDKDNRHTNEINRYTDGNNRHTDESIRNMGTDKCNPDTNHTSGIHKSDLSIRVNEERSVVDGSDTDANIQHGFYKLNPDSDKNIRYTGNDKFNPNDRYTRKNGISIRVSEERSEGDGSDTWEGYYNLLGRTIEKNENFEQNPPSNNQKKLARKNVDLSNINGNMSNVSILHNLNGRESIEEVDCEYSYSKMRKSVSLNNLDKGDDYTRSFDSYMIPFIVPDPPLFQETVKRLREGFEMVPTRGTFNRAERCVVNRLDASNNSRVVKGLDDSCIGDGRRSTRCPHKINHIPAPDGERGKFLRSKSIDNFTGYRKWYGNTPPKLNYSSRAYRSSTDMSSYNNDSMNSCLDDNYTDNKYIIDEQNDLKSEKNRSNIDNIYKNDNVIFENNYGKVNENYFDMNNKDNKKNYTRNFLGNFDDNNNIKYSDDTSYDDKDNYYDENHKNNDINNICNKNKIKKTANLDSYVADQKLQNISKTVKNLLEKNKFQNLSESPKKNDSNTCQNQNDILCDFDYEQQVLQTASFEALSLAGVNNERGQNRSDRRNFLYQKFVSNDPLLEY